MWSIGACRPSSSSSFLLLATDMVRPVGDCSETRSLAAWPGGEGGVGLAAIVFVLVLIGDVHLPRHVVVEGLLAVWV